MSTPPDGYEIFKLAATCVAIVVAFYILAVVLIFVIVQR